LCITFRTSQHKLVVDLQDNTPSGGVLLTPGCNPKPLVSEYVPSQCLNRIFHHRAAEQVSLLVASPGIPKSIVRQ
jgi:hypothetical protein